MKRKLKRKIIQLVVDTDNIPYNDDCRSLETTIYALCNDQTIWYWEKMRWKFSAIGPIPQTEISELVEKKEGSKNAEEIPKGVSAEKDILS